MNAAVIRDALLAAGATPVDDRTEARAAEETPVTRAELYERGFIGRSESARKRAALLAALALPAHLSVNALVELLALPAYRRKYRQYIEQTEVDPQ